MMWKVKETQTSPQRRILQRGGRKMKQPKVLALDLLLDFSGPPEDSRLRDLAVKEKEGKIKI
jgi:hypothetical protein